MRKCFYFLGAAACIMKAAFIFGPEGRFSRIFAGMIFCRTTSRGNSARPFKSIIQTARTRKRHAARGPRCKYTCNTSVTRLYCAALCTEGTRPYLAASRYADVSKIFF